MHTSFSRRQRVAFAATVAVTGLLGAVAPASGAVAAPSASDDTSTAAAAPALKPPKVVGEKCGGRTGVTVVVDFRNLHNAAGKVMNRVEIGCARGPQQDGLTALAAAGFTVDPDASFVCEIDNRPLPEDSVCASNGYWSYSHGARGGDWDYSGVGPVDWQPAAGSLEGWSWSPYDKTGWELPRVTPSDLYPALR